jgi:hypothetical protein
VCSLVSTGSAIDEKYNTSRLFVNEYLTRKSLAKLGYTFNGDNLEDFSVKIFNKIENIITEIGNNKAKKNGGT